MALPELRGTGRLLTNPRHGTAKTGDPWTSALIKFSTWRKTDNGWEEGEGTVASVIAFGDTAGPLLGYAKGDQIGVQGAVKAAAWNESPQLAITLTSCRTPERQTKKTPAAPGHADHSVGHNNTVTAAGAAA
jgi:single-stranded DNA-binding protein